MSMTTYTEPAPYRENLPLHGADIGHVKGWFLSRFLGDRRAVGVFRGHSGRRFDPAYAEGAKACPN